MNIKNVVLAIDCEVYGMAQGLRCEQNKIKGSPNTRANKCGTQILFLPWHKGLTQGKAWLAAL